jgi:hypothetical protein
LQRGQKWLKFQRPLYVGVAASGLFEEQAPQP